MSEQMPTSTQDAIQEAHNEASMVGRQAVRTGVPEVSDMRADDRKAVMNQEGIVRSDNNLVGSNFDVLVPGARITYDQDEKSVEAAVGEQTGNYYGQSIDAYGGGPAQTDKGEVYVSRPDGNGGTYTAKLRGENAEKATGIITKRAARKIGQAAIARDESGVRFEDQVAKAA